MKKITIGLIIAIVALLSSTQVFAAEPSATLAPNEITAKPGETFTINVNASCDDGLSYVGTSIEYDTDVLTLQSKTHGEHFQDWSGKATKLEMMVSFDLDEGETAEIIKNATVCTLTFKVNDNAEEGTTTVSTTDIDITDINNTEYTKPKSESIVTIVKEASEEPAQATDDTPKQEQTESKENKVEPVKSTENANTTKTENSNKKDNTTSEKTIPKTGLTMLTIPVVLFNVNVIL